MKVTPNDIVKAKAERRPIICLTAYDFPTAAVLDQNGVDILLVGDSLGMVVQGRPNTLGVTVEQLVYHTEMVSRAAARALVVADMPFMSFQESDAATMNNAGRLVKEGGAEAVKLEGAYPETLARIRKLISAGIPVIGHLGYTPQSTRVFGREVVRGKTVAQARSLIEDARRLEESGCFAIVLEMTPRRLAGYVASKSEVPIIGIGSGVDCDGQILVIHDLIGFYLGYSPKFVRKLTDVSATIAEAARQYAELVVNRQYPGEGEQVDVGDDVWAEVTGAENDGRG